jgi:alkyldihydroxyacetonephosphate synthase
VRRRRSHWGWGYEDEQPSADELRSTAAFLAGHLGFGSPDPETPVPLSDVVMPWPRLTPPEVLTAICSTDRYERAAHCYGRSYRDLVRGFRGQFDSPPDVVARPRDEEQLRQVLSWALSEGAAVIPFGGGTSVVGGVEAPAGDGFAGSVTIDMTALDQVLEVDRVSLAARVQAGASGPRIEHQLGEQGLTLRHFPQSFELSTLGGWIATRAGGHFATLYTHIDDLVESVRAITPIGVWESRRLPGSGAGISPDRVLIGSEGILGVITEAWVRVRKRPGHRASVPVRFTEFAAGVGAVRELSQSGLHPSNCRLIDAAECRLRGAGDGSSALLVVGRDHRPWYDRQGPQPFAEALRAAKAAVDPAGALNPGVLIDA